MGYYVLGVFVLAGLYYFSVEFRWMMDSRADNAALALLESEDTEHRRWGAWEAAQINAPRSWAHVAEKLRYDRESDPQVRESFVYALSRSGRHGYFDILAHVVAEDADPYVRQAAWLAAARLDEARFKELAATIPPRDEPWDAIGRAQGWLAAGDVRGVPVLLHWAENGSPEQRQVAAMALSHGVASLLEVIGRWPADARVQPGRPWPAELVAEVAARCRRLNLQAVLDDTRQYAERNAQLRRDVGRLHKTREHLAGYLTGQ